MQGIKHSFIIYLGGFLFMTQELEKKENILAEATFVAKTGSTVREAAKKFGVSKSTIHKDITERLRSIDSVLYVDVRKILLTNKALRHIRGGQATKEKYRRLKEQA